MALVSGSLVADVLQLCGVLLGSSFPLLVGRGGAGFGDGGALGLFGQAPLQGRYPGGQLRLQGECRLFVGFEAGHLLDQPGPIALEGPSLLRQPLAVCL